MRKDPLEQVNEGLQHHQEPEFAPEVVALLEQDKALNAGQHSIMDTWLALKAEAERHGYVARLVLPYDLDNLEIEYTDPQGERTNIFSMLFAAGEVRTTQDGLVLFNLPDDLPDDIEDSLSLVPERDTSNNMKDQTAFLRSSIEWHKKKGERLGKEQDFQSEDPQLDHEGP